MSDHNSPPSDLFPDGNTLNAVRAMELSDSALYEWMEEQMFWWLLDAKIKARVGDVFRGNNNAGVINPTT